MVHLGSVRAGPVGLLAALKRGLDSPLSDQALAILKTQHEARDRNEFIFPGRPMRPLSATQPCR